MKKAVIERVNVETIRTYTLRVPTITTSTGKKIKRESGRYVTSSGSYYVLADGSYYNVL